MHLWLTLLKHVTSVRANGLLASLQHLLAACAAALESETLRVDGTREPCFVDFIFLAEEEEQSEEQAYVFWASKNLNRMDHPCILSKYPLKKKQSVWP